MLQLGTHTPNGAVALLTVTVSQTYPVRQVLCPAPGPVQFPKQYASAPTTRHVPLKHVPSVAHAGAQYPPGKTALGNKQEPGSPVAVPVPVWHAWSLVHAAPGLPVVTVQALLLHVELNEQD